MIKLLNMVWLVMVRLMRTVETVMVKVMWIVDSGKSGESDVDGGNSDGEADVDGGNSDGEADVDGGNSDGDVDVDGGNSDGDSDGDQDSDGHNAGSKLPPIEKEVQLISMKIAHELLRMCLNELCKYFTISPFRIHESICFLSWFFQRYKFIKKLLTCIDENSSAILTVIIHNQINK